MGPTERSERCNTTVLIAAEVKEDVGLPFEFGFADQTTPLPG